MTVITSRDHKIKITQEDVDFLTNKVVDLLPSDEEKETFHMKLDPLGFKADAFLGNTAIPVTCRRFDYAKKMGKWEVLASGVIKDLRRQFSIDNDVLAFEPVDIYQEVNQVLVALLALAGPDFYGKYQTVLRDTEHSDEATKFQLQNKMLSNIITESLQELVQLRKTADLEAVEQKDKLIEQLKADNQDFIKNAQKPKKTKKTTSLKKGSK